MPLKIRQEHIQLDLVVRDYIVHKKRQSYYRTGWLPFRHDEALIITVAFINCAYLLVTKKTFNVVLIIELLPHALRVLSLIFYCCCEIVGATIGPTVHH